jgi:hypothetical protein
VSGNGIVHRGPGAAIGQPGLERPPDQQRAPLGTNPQPESPVFWDIGKNLPRYPKKGWEVVEIAALYDNAIIIEYLAARTFR